MEFWATEVKSGETSKVVPGHDMVLHLSQANLGEIKKTKGNENVYLFVNVGGQKLVLGTLSSERLPQQQFDLVFDQDFELSHNWKGGSVYFFGYKAANDIGDEDEGAEFDSDSEDEDVDIPLNTEITGKPETKVKEEKTVDVKKVNAGKDSSTDKKKVNLEAANGLPKSDGSEDEDSDDEDDSISDDEGDDMDEDDEDDSEDDEDDSEEEEKPAKAVPGKKRSSDAEPETPASKKKAKVITPQKTDGKKGGVHVSTPHPSKPAGKKASATENPKSPKSSGGSHVCKSCSRSFGTEGALDSHSKAKHSAGK